MFSVCVGVMGEVWFSFFLCIFFHASVLYTCFPMLICLVRSENWTNTLLYSVSCQSGVIHRQLELCQSGVVHR